MSVKRIVTLALPLAFVGLLVGTDPVLAAPAAGYKPYTVESGTSESTIKLGGTVVPYKEVSLAAQMPGRIDYIAGLEGDWFRRGTVLVSLDNAELRAKRESAMAQLAKAQAGWRNARVQYTRQVHSGSDMPRMTGMGVPRMLDDVFTNPMSEMMGTTDPELTRRAQIFQHGINIDQAQYSLMQAQAGLKELDVMMRNAKSIAPFDGVIITKSIEIGDTVQPGPPMLRFADTRNLQIKVDVPARLMPGIKKGMLVPATLDVGNTPVDARVAQIYPMADTQRHTVTIKLDLPADAPGGPGMYADVLVKDITAPIKSQPIIPKSAVVYRGSLPVIYVLTPDGNTELRAIRLGSPIDEHRISVLSGVRPGERILADPPENN